MPQRDRYIDVAETGRSRLPEALGEAESFLQFQEDLSRVAKVDRPVLIMGERGTGKELAVARLHYLSSRWQGPLVAMNCAALAPSLLEDELFGHEAGSFTGAQKRRRGRFEAAEEGTLFLDEIGLLPVEVQEKILRVVEYGQFERVGSSSPTSVNVRLIGATNVNLAKLANGGKFKRDLLDRLSFEVLFLPPLRARQEDILLLAQHFATRMAIELGREAPPDFTPEAEDALEAYLWPGNVRELKNVVERAVYRCEGDEITEICFDPFRSPYGELQDGAMGETNAPGTERQDERATANTPPLPGSDRDESKTEPATDDSAQTSFISNGFDFNRPLPEAVRELELGALQAALEKAKYHQGEAANLLGISYHQFRGLYRKYREEVSED